MNVGDVIHGFRIMNIRQADEIKADLYEMVHEKTGARTIWLKREDENKTFSIAFKTTPVDDTGVFHILEHSVLNGSDKYPVKEPFVDLLKGSLQTFLNAMTYPDKTVYPVCSRNDKDFINLMRVYLDAVFHPLVIKNPNVFYQEGWHYELENEDDDPIYKGVVFNEMKGAFSSPDGVRTRYMMHALFPDNCYGKESGGDPDYITDLTYEQFCDAHHKYYNPSNSYIFLDGDMNIEKILGIIDDEYLSSYGKEGDEIVIEKQSPVIAEDQTIDYEISAQSEPDGKAQIAYGYVIGNYDDFEKTTAMSLITSVLCSSNESELKKAILNNNLGEDVSFDVQDGILQPFCEIDVINTDLEKEEIIDKTIREVLEKAVRDGIDKKELEAAINQREFSVKERDFGRAPKGLVFGLTALDTWLYGGDPMDGICVNKLFDSLREKLNTSYYEDLLNECVLNSRHCAKIRLNPSNTLGEIKINKEKEKLNKIASTWTKEEKEKLISANNNLVEWQSTEDTPEQKATLPALHLEDLKKTPSDWPIEIESYNGNTIIRHSEDTDGISYVNLLCEVNDFNLEDYTLINNVLMLMGQLPTENYDVITLTREIRSILGNLDITLVPMASLVDGSQRNYVSASFSTLKRNNEKAAELIKEIIYRTKFDDKQAVRDIIKQMIFTSEQSFINSGHSLAVTRCAAYTSPVSAVSEYAIGYEAYRFMKNLDDNYDEKADEFISRLNEIRNRIFIRQRYTVSVAGEDTDIIIRSLIDDAPDGEVGSAIEKKPLGHRREGIVVPANISYAVNSNLMRDDIKNIGVMYVISNILTYDYLWTSIRVKGGAYGCGFRSGIGKSMSFYSYRDPSPANSLDVYKNTPDYLSNFLDNVDNIENYIVGTTGDYDPYLSLKAGIRSRDFEYLNEIRYEDKQTILDEILNVSKDDIRNTIPLFEKMNGYDNVCVIGNRQALEECDEMLDSIFDLNNK